MQQFSEKGFSVPLHSVSAANEVNGVLTVQKRFGPTGEQFLPKLYLSPSFNCLQTEHCDTFLSHFCRETSRMEDSGQEFQGKIVGKYQ